MTSDTAMGNRNIPTGGLRFDGDPVSIELSHETCQYVVSGNDGRTGVCYNLGNLPLVATDKGVILGEIKEAIKTGRKVTAETEKFGKSEFKKFGPILLGFTQHQSMHSIGRFGLNGILGLKDNSEPAEKM